MKNKAFSYFELIISITLIAFLSLLIYPKYRDYLILSKESSLEIELKNFRQAIYLYNLKKGKLPENLEILEKENFIQRKSELGKIKFNLKRKNENGNLIDPFGNEYIYDNKTGNIKTSTKKYENF